jgi:thiamine pyrophosphate-dependent acetolactate synthase large subunit-like protein
VSIAEGFVFRARRATGAAELEAALAEAFAADVPRLVEVMLETSPVRLY